MTSDLARFVVAAMPRVQLTATATASMRKKLLAAVVDPLLLSLSLSEARRLRAEGHGDALDAIVSSLTLPQLKKLSKAWNPKRALPKNVTVRDLQVELGALVNGRSEPAPPPPPPSRRPRAAHAPAK